MTNEVINYRTQKMSTKQGNQVVVVYIDPYTSESLYNHKDILKNYGAAWDGRNRRWYWVLSNDETKRKTQMEKMIEPCIRELNQYQDKGKPSKTPDEEIEGIRGLIAIIDDVINAKIETTKEFTPGDVEAVKQMMAQYKKELLAATTDEEFRKKFEPMLKRVIEGGRRYSIMNTILIMLQDPEATYVHSLSQWQKRNRYVIKHGARPICMWVPMQDPAARNKFIRQYLNQVGKKSESELTPTEQDEMFQLMSLQVPSKGVKLVPSFYDIRFTKVKPFKQDKVQGIDKGEHLVNTKSGNENGDLKWFDENTPETEESIRIYDALIKTIQKMGIKLSWVDNIDGSARGVSKGGSIDILTNAPKNIGTCNTLIHELSHEIFHHMELQNMNPTWKSYYLGRGEGRKIVEQQAELCAWIIMRFLGYDMKTNINYLGNWGINEENAGKVFDQVARAADKIADILFKELGSAPDTGNLNESILTEGITGLDVAKMVGMENLYLKSKQKEQAALEESQKAAQATFNRIFSGDGIR